MSDLPNAMDQTQKLSNQKIVTYPLCKVSSPRHNRRHNPARRRTNTGWKYTLRSPDTGKAHMDDMAPLLEPNQYYPG